MSGPEQGSESGPEAVIRDEEPYGYAESSLESSLPQASFYRPLWTTVSIVLYVFLTVVGILMATGLLLPEVAYADPSSQFSGQGLFTELFVPTHLYLFSFLGALAHVFIIMFLNPVFLENSERFQYQLVWASVRIPLAVLLATGLYLLTALLGFNFSSPTLAGVAFLVGLYVKETVMAFVAVIQRLFKNEDVNLDEFYFGEPASWSPLDEHERWDTYVFQSPRITLLIIGLYVGLTVLGTAMSAGLLFPHLVFMDPSTAVTGDGFVTTLFIPPHMYLFSFLGALAHVFIIIFLNPDFDHLPKLGHIILWASVRIPLAVLLVSGFYLLTTVLGFNFPGRTLAGVSFLVGLYVKETVMLFVTVVNRLFKIDGVDLNEFYFPRRAETDNDTNGEHQPTACQRCEREDSPRTILDDEIVCVDCLSPAERTRLEDDLHSRTDDMDTDGSSRPSSD